MDEFVLLEVDLSNDDQYEDAMNHLKNLLMKEALALMLKNMDLKKDFQIKQQ